MNIFYCKKDQSIIAVFFIAFLMLAGGCHEQDESNDKNSEVINEDFVDVNYELSSEVIVNPERGFMHTYSVMAEGPALSKDLLNNLKDEKVTLILRLYYLDKFKNAPLSNAQLALIEKDFNSIREAGIKCILRFAYTDQMEGEDASIERVEEHLDQIKNLVTANADIIAFVQAGFIGAWGEWHASSNNLTTLENKKRVLFKLLETFPKSILIQVRTPEFKREIFNYSQAINESVGYGDSELARIGFHNDCFMASPDDYGTYGNVTADKNYISDEALFVPTGGETCPPSGIPAASCKTAEDEMSLLKWTYLNLDYYGPVLNGWRNEECFEDFQKKLGYRVALHSASFPKEISASQKLEFELNFVNNGFAPLYLLKDTFLILKSKSGNETFEKPLEIDLRKVVPGGTLKVTESISVAGMPVGDYSLYLVIKDSSENLKDNTSYRVQLANKESWNAASGVNDLKYSVKIK